MENNVSDESEDILISLRICDTIIKHDEDTFCAKTAVVCFCFFTYTLITFIFLFVIGQTCDRWNPIFRQILCFWIRIHIVISRRDEKILLQ